MASIFTTSKNAKIKNGSGKSQSIPFYLQFVPGQVVDVCTSVHSYYALGKEKFVNTIIAEPHLTDGIKLKRGQHGSEYRYYPMFRGMVDVPAKGDPVLLCTIGGTKYYLGPLNTDNSPNWNSDKLKISEVDNQTMEMQPEVFQNITKGMSPNFIKQQQTRLQKTSDDDLDNLNDDSAVNETHGDMMFEGRHGNSIRIGSRFIDPYIIISNNRGIHNHRESLADGSLISITATGTLKSHFKGYHKHLSSQQQRGASEDMEFRSYPEFKLSSDDVDGNKRLMSFLVKSINKVDDIYNTIYGYDKNQIFLNSERIILDSKSDDIYLSSFKDIHIGTGRHLTISTNKNLTIESEKSYLGDPNKEVNKDKMEPMVLGKQLIEVLTDTLAALKEAQGICSGAPLPLVDKTAAPLSAKIIPIEQKLNRILSQHHFIEPNGNKS